MEYKITENINKFMFGGNSYFTIKNEVSGKFAKYHIQQKGIVFFVSIKDGADYIYAGFMRPDNVGTYKFFQGKAGNYTTNDEEVRGLLWVISHAHNLDKRISVIHHGKCACCGRKLDDEVSIKRGFGSVCWKKMMGIK